MSLIELILRDLRELPADKLEEVAHYVRSLKPKSRESRFAALAATVGCMPGKQGEDFERAVREM